MKFTKTETLEVNVPSLVECPDYHDFDSMQSNFSKFNKKLKVVELDLDDYGHEFTGIYVGLVYLAGKKPNKSQIKRMLEEKYAEPSVRPRKLK